MSDTQNKDEKSSTVQTPTQFVGVRHAHLGPILAILVIMLVLVASGLYLWGGALSQDIPQVEERRVINREPETPRATADVQITETLSPSDSIEAIEADISSTNFDSLDAELSTIDTELDSALQVQ